MRYFIVGILAFGIIYVVAKDMNSVYDKANRGIAYDRCVGASAQAYRIEEGIPEPENTEDTLIEDPLEGIPDEGRTAITEGCAKETGVHVR